MKEEILPVPDEITAVISPTVTIDDEPVLLGVMQLGLFLLSQRDKVDELIDREFPEIIAENGKPVQLSSMADVTEEEALNFLNVGSTKGGSTPVGFLAGVLNTVAGYNQAVEDKRLDDAVATLDIEPHVMIETAWNYACQFARLRAIRAKKVKYDPPALSEDIVNGLSNYQL